MFSNTEGEMKLFIKTEKMLSGGCSNFSGKVFVLNKNKIDKRFEAKTEAKVLEPKQRNALRL